LVGMSEWKWEEDQQAEYASAERVSLIAALLTLHDQVVAPILAGARRPRPGRPPKTHTHIDRDTLRDDMRTLSHDLAINAAA
jgi:hypothetical protein